MPRPVKRHDPAAFDELDAGELMASLKRLQADIAQRFGGRGLVALVARIIAVAEQTEAGVARATAPNIGLRVALSLGMVATLAAPAAAIYLAGFRLAPLNGETIAAVDLLQGLDGLFNIVFLGLAGVFFVVTIEERLKRRAALTELHRIRSLIHVIDMHQLNKDPGHIDARELRAYLGYCTDLLSLCGKLGALYAQGTRDAIVIETVNDIEALSNNLSRKIWQKIALAETAPARLA